MQRAAGEGLPEIRARRIVTVSLDGRLIAKYPQQLITEDLRAGARRPSLICPNSRGFVSVSRWRDRDAVAFLALMALGAAPASAQTGGMQILSSSGSWVAFSHSPDDVNVDVCVAGLADDTIAFRSAQEEIEVRTSDDHWNLPPNTTGDILVKVGSYSTTLHALMLDEHTLSVPVQSADIQPLMDAMDKASSASVTFGTKTTKALSLSGSTAALNAFRACSNRAGFALFTGTVGKAATPF